MDRSITRAHVDERLYFGKRTSAGDFDNTIEARDAGRFRCVFIAKGGKGVKGTLEGSDKKDGTFTAIQTVTFADSGSIMIPDDTTYKFFKASYALDTDGTASQVECFLDTYMGV